MSEYWKSIPKYECKYCKQFVKDTKFERKQHEAGPRHQGNLKRALNEIHKKIAQEEREKQNAANEIARVKRVATGERSKVSFKPAFQTAPAPPIANLHAERQRQAAQLAELGIAIPQAYRGEVAQAGEWEAVEVVRRVRQPSEGFVADDDADEENEEVKGEEGGPIKNEDDEDISPRPSSSTSNRKRKLKIEPEEESADEDIKPPAATRPWEARTKQYPGYEKSMGDDNLDQLLSASLGSKVKNESDSELSPPSGGVLNVTEEMEAIKAEAAAFADEAARFAGNETEVKQEPGVSDDEVPPEVVSEPVIFKKRRPKQISAGA